MRFLCVIGTRPEAIKLAPLVLQLSRQSHVTILCSGQHTTLVREPLAWFGIEPDDEIVIAPDARSLAALTGALLPQLERMIDRYSPDVVIAQGDTTTVLVAALTAFYLDRPFAHVEAGLRTGDLRAPFPEEFNRVVASKIAQWHFCPTTRAVEALRAEGVDPARLFLTGNTGIDALRLTLEKLAQAPQPPAHDDRRRRILLTAHRRENHGRRLGDICEAVRAIAREFEDVEFVIPVHPNPAVRSSFEELLQGVDRVQLLEPLTYPRLISEMSRAHLILTDSGGIQEEAPFLKKPVLVMRDVTERPEAVDMGVARLVGTDVAAVTGAVRELLTRPDAYARMAGGGSPYGDGRAAERIAAVLCENLPARPAHKAFA
jgi:UDP-N-acetylglucosamine 2-epimerase (non-hydrolysing)